MTESSRSTASRSKLVVLVPVLGRPHRVKPFLASLGQNTSVKHRVLFLPSPKDSEEITAIEAAGAAYYPLDGGYAAKINAGVALTEEPWIFLGADDLEFHAGWFEAALATVNPEIGVIGVNDMIPRKFEHATHFLLRREYAELPTIDGQHGPLFTGYHHERVDNELIATAKYRDAYAYAPDALVRHHHPMVGAEDDETYRLGRQRGGIDRQKFNSRRKLWR